MFRAYCESTSTSVYADVIRRAILQKRFSQRNTEERVLNCAEKHQHLHSLVSVPEVRIGGEEDGELNGAWRAVVQIVGKETWPLIILQCY